MAKILIVEDEEKLARFLELELSHEGYAVAKAGDGRTGLTMAESGGFDLIVLDIMLPELSGLELLRRLRRTSSAGSGRPSRLTASTSMEAGCRGQRVTTGMSRKMP